MIVYSIYFPILAVVINRSGRKVENAARTRLLMSAMLPTLVMVRVAAAAVDQLLIFVHLVHMINEFIVRITQSRSVQVATTLLAVKHPFVHHATKNTRVVVDNQDVIHQR
jgi:hypothetical protein